jgi:hypothetical protein
MEVMPCGIAFCLSVVEGMSNFTANEFSLAPLGAGDLIDRAARFYRQNFLTLVFIAAPPIVIGTLISVGWTFLSRSLFAPGTRGDTLEMTVYYLFVWLGTVVIWFTETVATLAVMGGASRNFVRHILFGEPLAFADTYRNTRKRLGGLIAASFIITALLGFVGLVVFYGALFAGALLITLIVAAFQAIAPLAVMLAVVIGLAVFAGGMWLFFLVASRFAYVPQVMLVEGRGVFQAIGRSAVLASGNVRRLAALFIFSTVATYSALAILYVPLGWYAWVEGVELFTFGGGITPGWYEIASQLVWQVSLVLLTPVWMVGLCLLYVDERVRHEGYDIELLAARRLGEIPELPETYINPLQPALANESFELHADPGKTSSITTLGL